ncbi:hypothetical protein V2J09_002864 [Rumex salicifolius]
MFNRSFAAWINDFLGCIGVCLGNYSKSTTYPHGHGSQIFSSDNFWTSSMNDIDMNANLSQRMHSSTTSNSSLRCDVTSTVTNSHPEFTNHGLCLWNETRTNWTGGQRQLKSSHQGLGRMIGIYSSYESLLGTNRPFRKPIPLSEMVEFLVDIWDEEGLYD